MTGRWVKGPGAEFFKVLQQHLGQLPLIVEDLGIITSEVDDLKHQFYFPGIKVLQFSFYYGESGHCKAPSYERNSVLYTGTHDNDTTASWYEELVAKDPKIARCVAQYIEQQLGTNDETQSVCSQLVEVAYQSNANTVIVPLQDILDLGNEARMNLPGTVGSNWGWQCPRELLTKEVSMRLADLVTTYNRQNKELSKFSKR